MNARKKGASKSASCSQPADKCARLAMLGRSSYVTKSGIEGLLKSVGDEGIPDASSRRSQYRARKELVCERSTPYGPLVEEKMIHMIDGAEYTVGFQNPQAFLFFACKVSGQFASIMRHAHAVYPSSRERPWNLLLYQDGIDPSDGLAKNHSRKCQAFYWAFLEYGMAALSQEQVWGTVTLARYLDTCKMDGNICKLTSLVLDRFFGSKHDFGKVGVAVELHGDGKVIYIYAMLGSVFGDEPALKEMLGCKGHGGLRPCLLCMNVVLHRALGKTVALWEIDHYFKSIVTTDTTKFKMYTNRSMRLAVQRLHAAKASMTIAEFEEEETQKGWSWNPSSIVLNDKYGIADAVMFDWAHIYMRAMGSRTKR